MCSQSECDWRYILVYGSDSWPTRLDRLALIRVRVSML